MYIASLVLGMKDRARLLPTGCAHHPLSSIPIIASRIVSALYIGRLIQTTFFLNT